MDILLLCTSGLYKFKTLYSRHSIVVNKGSWILRKGLRRGSEKITKKIVFGHLHVYISQNPSNLIKIAISHGTLKFDKIWPHAKPVKYSWGTDEDQNRLRVWRVMIEYT